jgi:regulation of enolase protein 1 (concanavalin A-like superfamily)
MACTPERSGLSVRFSDLRITAPLGKDLHDLS